ncbi:hypothetical protein P154DRAFT_43500 [Amniculicola lignicola CBS 123094]|uniref:Uncharacterized protein n=1 Tax=Amniculicola lignicola CBS 123094 TaxID=1392246 RepID=A0A6A5WU19_9PLEO|nr:hypothetical protein P154DRAFT_43500 [Amniculicola lignicola CBS 123094]
MADVRTIFFVVLHCVSWPLIKLFLAVTFILSPFWAILSFILLPITSLLHVLFSVVLFPFRQQLLDKIETIYIYLGIAGIIGCATGAILHFCFNILSSSLNIDTAAEAKAREKGRTVAAFREARRKKKAQSLGSSPVSTPTMLRGPRRQRGLLSQTIIEEEDSDF